MAIIHSIVYQPKDQPYPQEIGEYFRVPIEKASLIAGIGIDGDDKAGRHPDRQLNILSLEWLQSIKSNGFKTDPGQFGEQLILSGIDLHALQPGTKLRLGDTAIIEIIKPRTGCDRLEAAQGISIASIRDKIGMLAAVRNGGKIKTGDVVTQID